MPANDIKLTSMTPVSMDGRTGTSHQQIRFTTPKVLYAWVITSSIISAFALYVTQLPVVIKVILIFF